MASHWRKLQITLVLIQCKFRISLQNLYSHNEILANCQCEYIFPLWPVFNFDSLVFHFYRISILYLNFLMGVFIRKLRTKFLKILSLKTWRKSSNEFENCTKKRTMDLEKNFHYGCSSLLFYPRYDNSS